MDQQLIEIGQIWIDGSFVSGKYEVEVEGLEGMGVNFHVVRNPENIAAFKKTMRKEGDEDYSDKDLDAIINGGDHVAETLFRRYFTLKGSE